MLYSEFITKLRADVGDFPIRRYDSADGDASTSVFQLKHPKILEGSYTFKVGGATKTETTHYTLDKNVGQVIFTTGNIPGAGSDNVTFEYQSVNQLDADWLEIINQILSQLRKKFWKEISDETTLTTVANQHDYALSGIASDIIQVIDFEYRTSSSERWIPVRTLSDVVFYRDLQKLHLKQPFQTSGYELRIRAIRAFTQGSLTSSTFEPQDRFHTAIRKFCHAEYLSRMAMEMLKYPSAVAKEKAFESMTEVTKLARDKKQEAMEDLKRVRLPRPAFAIPIAVKG